MDKESVDRAIQKRFQHLYKKKNGENKRILQHDERQFRSNYAGTEKSPYHEYRERIGNHNQEGDMLEPDTSSLDGIDETKSLYYQSDDARESPQYEKILKALPSLTKRQRDIMRMVGYEGRSFSECAKLLNISKGTVQKTIERIRHKIDKKTECSS